MWQLRVNVPGFSLPFVHLRMIASSQRNHWQGTAFGCGKLSAKPSVEGWQESGVGGCHGRSHRGNLHVLLNHLVVIVFVVQQAGCTSFGWRGCSPLLPHRAAVLSSIRAIHGRAVVVDEC